MYDLFIVDVPGNDWNTMDLQEKFPHARTIPHVDTLENISACVSMAKTKYVWVIHSGSNYSKFDFDFTPVPWESNQLHCWGNQHSKFGDTFLVPSREFRNQRPSMMSITDFKDIHWHEEIVPRLQNAGSV